MQKNNSGFSLLEAVLYMAIVSLLFAAVVTLHLTIGGTSAKLGANIDAARNRRVALQAVDYLSRNADGLWRSATAECSDFDGSPNELALWFENDDYLPGTCVETGGGVRISATSTRVRIDCYPNIGHNGKYNSCGWTKGNSYYLTGPEVRIGDNDLTFNTSTVTSTLSGILSLTTHLEVGLFGASQTNLGATSSATSTVVLLNERSKGLSTWWKLNDSAVTAPTGGDIAVYRDGSGLFDTNQASNANVPFNHVVRQDAAYTIDGSFDDITINETGHYLFGYAVSAAGVNTARQEFRTKMHYNGEVQLYGNGAGYRRENVNTDYISYGYGILNATTTGKDASVQVINVSTTNAAASLEDEESTLWFLQLNDDWAYFTVQGEDNKVGTIARQNIDWDTAIENTDTDVFGHDTGSNPEQVTLKEAGHYLVIYAVGVDKLDDGLRSSITTNISINDNDVPQSFDYSYVRALTSTNVGVATNMSIIEASANDILRVRFGCVGATSCGNTNDEIQTVSAATILQIVKLPDSADYLRVYETTGGQSFGGENGVITFDTEDEADSTSFSYDGTATTTIQQAGDYIFTAGARAFRTDTASTRLSVKGGFYVNGTATSTSWTHSYGPRGLQGAYGTYDGGWSTAALMTLASSDTIDFRQVDNGDNGGTQTLQGGYYGITAVNIDSLFAADQAGTDSISGNDLACYPNPTAETAALINTSNSSFDFELSDGDMCVATNADEINFDDQFTISVWVQPESLSASAEEPIVSKQNGLYGYELYLNSADDYVSCRVCDGTTCDDNETSYAPSVATAYHLACVYNYPADTMTIYVYEDGSNDRATSTFSSLPILVNTTSSLYLSESPYFDGVIDDVRLFNRALTEDEIYGLRSVQE